MFGGLKIKFRGQDQMFHVEWCIGGTRICRAQLKKTYET